MPVLSTPESLRFLAEAGRVLAESLELDATLDRVARLLIPRLADICGIHLADAGGELQRVAAAHSDPEKMRLAVDLYAKFPIRKDNPYGIAQVFRTGESELIAQVAEENLVRVARTPEQLEVLKSLGLRSSLIVPLKARTRILGTLSLVMGDSGRNFDAEDLLLVEELGQRMGLAVENARLFQETRRQADALRAGEERLRLALDAGRIGAWEWDIRSGAIAWSEKVYEIHGLPPGGFSGRMEDFQRLIHPEDAEPVGEAIRKVLEEGAPYQIEFRILRPSGEVRWISTSARLVKPAEGGPGRLIGAVVDVTDRRRTEEALRKSETLYRAVTENSPQLTWMSDAQGRSLFYNRQWTAYTGKPIRGGEEGANLDILHADDRPALMETRQRGLETNEPYELEFRVRRADGAWRWHLARVVPVWGEDGKLQYWFGSATDVHDLREAQENLRKSSEEFRAMFELAGSGKLQADALSGKLLRVNRRFCAVAGRPEAELLGMAYPDLVFGEDRAAVEAVLDEVRRGDRKDWYVEARIVRGDGTLRWVQVTGTVLAAEDAGPGRLLATVHDVTERKLAEEEARSTQEKFRQSQKLESIGRLAGGIAHDFNNLLTAINGYADLLLMGIGEDTPQAGYVREIRQSGERAASLTRQLLAYSRRQILTPAVADLNVIVARLANMLGRLLGETIRLSTDLEASLPKVKVDAGQIDQVILNLAVNARDAMPDGGSLVIRTASRILERPEEAHDAMIPAGRYVGLEIEDSGHGMSEDVLARLFEPFFTTKEVGKGTGLGLSMVQGIVRQSGGFIRVESAPMRGTRFGILFPAVESDGSGPGETAGESLPEGSSGAGAAVLLVEDEDAVRRYVSEILSRSGYRVLAASSGSEAIRLAESHPGEIDLLLSDVVMPGMTGPAVAEALAPSRPRMKVLFMSGYSDASILRYGILGEKGNFLQKPFSPAELLGKARETLAHLQS